MTCSPEAYGFGAANLSGREVGRDTLPSQNNPPLCAASSSEASYFFPFQTQGNPLDESLTRLGAPLVD